MKNYIIQISIHVPSWGTTVSVFRIRSINEFQSTFPRGERPVPGHVVSDFIRISIHVPSWGTTIPGLMVSALLSLFQSTFPRGERPSRRSSFSLESDFNPRSLVGNDQVDQASLQYVQNFNPRSLVGNDCKFSQIFFVFLCNKYNFSTFYYPFSLFFSVIHVTFLIFVVRILPAFYVYF